MFETCAEIRSLLSDYLDDLCSPEARKSVRYHLTYCVPCAQKVETWRNVREELRAMPRRQVPPEIALRLRVKLSHLVHHNPLSVLKVQLENALKPLLIPATGGVLTAIIAFGLFMGSGGVPINNGPDVTLEPMTPARVQVLAPMDFDNCDYGVLLVTQVNSAGRAKSYQVLSGQNSPELRERLDRMIYFSVFQPATISGRPTDGEVVLSLKRITVRG